MKACLSELSGGLRACRIVEVDPVLSYQFIDLGVATVMFFVQPTWSNTPQLRASVT